MRGKPHITEGKTYESLILTHPQIRVGIQACPKGRTRVAMLLTQLFRTETTVSKRNNIIREAIQFIWEFTEWSHLKTHPQMCRW